MREGMLYEVVNPSDTVTFEANDPLVAAVAGLVLGRGAYGVVDAKGSTVLPVLLLGGVDEWVAEHLGDLGVWLDEEGRREAVATALRSLHFGEDPGVAASHAVLLVPAEGDPLLLLAEGPCSARPPTLREWGCSVCGGRWWGDSYPEGHLHDSGWLSSAVTGRRALVLAWEGEVLARWWLDMLADTPPVKAAAYAHDVSARWRLSWEVRALLSGETPGEAWLLPEAGTLVCIDAEGREVTDG